MAKDGSWQTWGKRLMVLPPIVLAVVVFMWLAKHPPSLSKHAEEESARMLNTIVVPRLDVRPIVSGYGTAKYARSWRAVAQVQGRIKKINPDLRAGARIRAGKVLLEIDDSDYVSRVSELDAAMDQQRAEIEQLEQTILNGKKKLELQNETLLILRREFEREEELQARQAGSSASIDLKHRELLAQSEAMQDLENSLALVPSQIKALEAAMSQSEAQKVQALRDIERAKIATPFDMRVGEVQLEVGQFVSVGEALFTGYSGADMEVEVQLPLQDIHRLLVSEVGEKGLRESLTPETFKEMFQFEALIQVVGTDFTQSYPGEFLQVREVVDAQTKMVGFVVGVTNLPPSEQKRPQPPLLEGAFCDVDVLGKILSDQVVIPRRAIRNGSVFLVDDKNRLAKADVDVTFTQEDYAVVGSGLEGGETLVIANPSPAIIGMLVEPIAADDELEKLTDSVHVGDKLYQQAETELSQTSS
ncbi:multidrug efflux system subunit MdtA [Rosistilla carotiformis]|uniref:Multidrug efflux system subunit MdtA n=1 Tax=Rosistilla carotiformis TaxID=2528017 RepID=A0A518JY77_9BACT|nr:HlyD family efflux transporter periplasmic adaptor subunit [Rosistilla carotiformis]QDV70498.1 multidrug efflux system subunit MdtA [Rosistilla carotiformis]